MVLQQFCNINFLNKQLQYDRDATQNLSVAVGKHTIQKVQ